MMKTLIFVGAGLLIGGALAAAVGFAVVPGPLGPVAEARAAAEKAKPKPSVTVMYPTKERVVNLTDKASPRYLKVALTLEFLDAKAKEPPKGEAVKVQQEEFAAE